MTKFTVVWKQSARDELAEIWLNATDRTSIASAANAIDVALANDADEKGTEIREALRVLVMPPLRALFSVREADRIVEVDKVSHIRPAPDVGS